MVSDRPGERSPEKDCWSDWPFNTVSRIQLQSQVTEDEFCDQIPVRYVTPGFKAFPVFCQHYFTFSCFSARKGVIIAETLMRLMSLLNIGAEVLWQVLIGACQQEELTSHVTPPVEMTLSCMKEENLLIEESKRKMCCHVQFQSAWATGVNVFSTVKWDSEAATCILRGYQILSLFVRGPSRVDFSYHERLRGHRLFSALPLI